MNTQTHKAACASGQQRLVSAVQTLCFTFEARLEERKCLGVGSLVVGGCWGVPFLNVTLLAFSKLPVLHWIVALNPHQHPALTSIKPQVTAKNHPGAEKGTSNDSETAQSQAEVLTSS